jgi:hypothetical protein
MLSFLDQRIVEQILPVIFPNGNTLTLLRDYIGAQNITIARTISQKTANYLNR